MHPAFTSPVEIWRIDPIIWCKVLATSGGANLARFLNHQQYFSMRSKDSLFSEPRAVEYMERPLRPDQDLIMFDLSAKIFGQTMGISEIPTCVGILIWLNYYNPHIVG